LRDGATVVGVPRRCELAGGGFYNVTGMEKGTYRCQ
jgi:hypothetical protein